MAGKDEVVSLLQSIGGKKANIKIVTNAIEQFFENLDLELEDWKISMEEFQEGTRIFFRFQILVKH